MGTPRRSSALRKAAEGRVRSMPIPIPTPTGDGAESSSAGASRHRFGRQSKGGGASAFLRESGVALDASRRTPKGAAAIWTAVAERSVDTALAKATRPSASVPDPFHPAPSPRGRVSGSVSGSKSAMHSRWGEPASPIGRIDADTDPDPDRGWGTGNGGWSGEGLGRSLAPPFWRVAGCGGASVPESRSDPPNGAGCGPRRRWLRRPSGCRFRRGS